MFLNAILRSTDIGSRNVPSAMHEKENISVGEQKTELEQTYRKDEFFMSTL